MRVLRIVATVVILLASSLQIRAQGIIPIPGIIEIENYSSFFDNSPGNEGTICRTDDVDLFPTWDAPAPPGGCNLGWTEGGEWLGFTISVPETQTLVLSARVAHPGVGGTFHVELDGVNVTGVMTVPNTGAWDNFQTIRRHGVYVTAGQHTLKLIMDSESPTTGAIGAFNYLALTRSAPLTTAATVPGRLEAEDFDRNPNGGSGEGFAYHDTTPANLGGAYRVDEAVDISVTGDIDGSYNVAWTERAEWLGYTINVASAGQYTFNARIAHPGQGGTFHVEIDGDDRTGPITVPDTGGWGTWQTISVPNVPLAAGQHVMYVAVDSVSGITGALANVNWFSFTGNGVALTTGHRSYQPLDDGTTYVVVDNYSSFSDEYVRLLVIGADRSTKEEAMTSDPLRGLFGPYDRVFVNDNYLAWFDINQTSNPCCYPPYDNSGALAGYWTLQNGTLVQDSVG